MRLHNHPRVRAVGWAQVWVAWEEGCFACEHRTLAELLRIVSFGWLS